MVDRRRGVPLGSLDAASEDDDASRSLTCCGETTTAFALSEPLRVAAGGAIFPVPKDWVVDISLASGTGGTGGACSCPSNLEMSSCELGEPS